MTATSYSFYIHCGLLMVLLIQTINYLTCINILNVYFSRSEIVFLKQ